MCIIKGLLSSSHLLIVMVGNTCKEMKQRKSNSQKQSHYQRTHWELKNTRTTKKGAR